MPPPRARAPPQAIPPLAGDLIAGNGTGDPGILVTVPLALILAYGAARILSLAFNEARDAIFINVAQRAIRTVALEVFRHLHSLSMRFHLGRQTGRLSLSIERGTRAIESLLRSACSRSSPP